jgi:hypothetical protein
MLATRVAFDAIEFAAQAQRFFELAHNFFEGLPNGETFDFGVCPHGTH